MSGYYIRDSGEPRSRRAWVNAFRNTNHLVVWQGEPYPYGRLVGCTSTMREARRRIARDRGDPDLKGRIVYAEDADGTVVLPDLRAASLSGAL